MKLFLELNKLHNKQKEKADSFFQFIVKKKFLSQWFKIYHQKEITTYSDIKNRIAINFLINMILSLRYSNEKKNQKLFKYFNSYKEKNKAIQCLNKVIFILIS